MARRSRTLRPALRAGQPLGSAAAGRRRSPPSGGPSSPSPRAPGSRGRGSGGSRPRGPTWCPWRGGRGPSSTSRRSSVQRRRRDPPWPEDSASSCQRPREARSGMTDTRLTRPDGAGEQPPRRPKHARRSEIDFPWPDAPDAPDVPNGQPRTTPPPPGGRDLQPPATPHLGNDYRLRGLNVSSAAPAAAAPAATATSAPPAPASYTQRLHRRHRRLALRPRAVGPELASGAGAGCSWRPWPSRASSSLPSWCG